MSHRVSTAMLFIRALAKIWSEGSCQCLGMFFKDVSKLLLLGSFFFLF